MVRYIAMQFITTASNTFISEYCERIDNNVVNTPEPTNNGKTIGIIVASLDTPVPSQNILTSNIISIANKNNIKEPAIANDDKSTPNKSKKASPA
jgi:hypothetical protein